MKIRTRVIGAALLAVSVASIVNAFYVIGHQRGEALAKLQADIQETDRLIAVVMAGPLYDGNVDQLQRNLDTFLRNPEVVRISLAETNGDIRLTRERASVGERGETIESKVDVVRGPDHLGEIRTTYSTALIEMQLAHSRNQLIVFSVALLLVLSVVILVVARTMTGPIDRLTMAARAMAQGDLDREFMDSGGAEELAVLADSFTRMRKAIKEKIAALAQSNERLQQEMNERRRAADELRIRDHALQTSFNAVAMADLSGRLNYVNESFLDLWGYASAQEVLGRSASEFWTDPGKADEVMLALARGSSRWRGELVARSKDGRAIPVEVWASMATGSNGAPLGLIASFMDISERKAAQDALQSLNAELERRVAERTAALARANEKLATANRELESFSYSVSHDLRAPLRAMAGYSSIILEENKDRLDAETARQLDRIHAGAMRMGMLIDDLLRLSRVGRWEMNRQDFDLSGLVSSVAASLAEEHPKRKVELSVKPDMQANGDPGLVRHILENLLGNAWKFTALKDVARVEAGSEARGDEMAYFVRDNGAGFDMQFSDKLFQACQRLHHPDAFEGTGIGLSIVQRAVSRHGGRVCAEGKEGHGATFWFTLGSSAGTDPS